VDEESSQHVSEAEAGISRSVDCQRLGNRGTSRNLWHYKTWSWALRYWTKWLNWAMRCRLEPMKEAARTIRNHLRGILNVIILKASNGPGERINSRIKTIKVRARGFRNKGRFVDAIYFHLGGLDPSPEF